MEIKPTCAPQYYRICGSGPRPTASRWTSSISPERPHARMPGGRGLRVRELPRRGLPCGYYPLLAGNIREKPFREIWEKSELMTKLRDFKGYGGACGHCGYIKVCGGCRRGLRHHRDDLAAEPFCSHGLAMEE